MKKTLLRHLPAVIFLFLLAVSIFIPILQNPSQRIAGDLTGINTKDAYQNIWNFWWAKKNCLGLCGNLQQTDFQFYPLGTSLLFQTWAYPSLFLFVPLALLGLNLVTVYNLSLLFAVIMALLGAYFLVYTLTKSRPAALVSGIVYGLSPFLIGHIMDGQLNLSNIGYFPFFLLFLIRAQDKNRMTDLFLSGLFLLIIGLNDFTYLILAFLLWCFVIGGKLIRRRVPIKELVRKNLLIFLIFFIPFFVLTINNFKEFSNFNLSGDTRWDANYSSANTLSFITPPDYTLLGNKLYSNAYQKYEGIYSDKSLFLGVVPFILATLGGIYILRKGKNRFWIYVALTGLVLSMGPDVRLGAKTYHIWMPYELLGKIPVLDILRAPSRFAVILMLGLSVLAGFGVLAIDQRINSRRIIRAVYVIIVFGILAELFPFHLPVTDIYIPDGYREIMKDASDFAIIETPTIWMSGLSNSGGHYPIEVLYYQTLHQKRIAGGYITRMPKDLDEAYAEIPILRFMINKSKNTGISTEITAIRERYGESYIQGLKLDNPYKYLVVLKHPLWTELNNDIIKTLGDYIELQYRDAEIEIYRFKE